MEKDWKKQLRHEASLHHMCGENRAALSEVKSKVEAVALYKKTVDWAIKEGYPDMETIRRYFSDADASGVFVDRHFDGEVLDDQQVYVFHNCTGTIRTGLNVDKAIIPMLHFANGCDMRVESCNADNMPCPVRVPLYIYGDSRVEAEESARLHCLKYLNTKN